MDYLFFDIESTGLSTENDRIVQLAIVIVNEKGETVLAKSKLYNPGIKISKTAEETHHISDKDVEDAPSFREDAKKLAKLFENKIIVGYNILKFDLPMLVKEFQRCKIEPNFSGKIIDALLVERKINTNQLADTYFRYTGKKLSGAHDALNDVVATVEILKHQTSKVIDSIEDQYQEQAMSDESIEEMLYEMSGTKDMLDFSGKLGKDKDGYLIFKFGKSKGKRVIDDADYASWILSQDFPTQVKDMIRAEQSKHAIAKKDSFKTKSYNFSSMGGGNSKITFDDDLPF